MLRTESKDSPDSRNDSSITANRMKGMKIRDEFICPITYELMREPIVASDGHTYEKSAIEKWLKTRYLLDTTPTSTESHVTDFLVIISKTSPRIGEPIDTTLIPNHNLKKLIQDIINEVSPTYIDLDLMMSGSVTLLFY